MDNLKIAEMLNNYSVTCKEQKNFHAAKVALKRAIALHPNASILWGNLGVILWNLNEFIEAEKALKHALTLIPDHEKETVIASPYANYGLLCASLQRWDEAEDLFKKAIAIEKEKLNPQWDYACMLLEKGDWERGLDAYEVRLPFKNFPKFPFPMWNGEDLNNKTIYIQSEQGMGDRILFGRYLFWLKEKYPNARIIFLSDSPGVSLFWEFKEQNIVEFLPIGVPYPKADFGIYLLSLPKFHGSRPDNIPKDPGLIKKRILPYAKYCNLPQPHTKSLKVGIAWTGNPEQDLNLFRTIPFELMLSLAENPNVTLYSLQVGDGTETIKKFNAGEIICDLAPDLKTYVQTGQTMMHLDLVISCCTSVLHLAGALDIPAWGILPSNPYWVWLTDRSDSIWYPSVKLYRQKTPGNWDIINKVKEDLNELANKTKFGLWEQPTPTFGRMD